MDDYIKRSDAIKTVCGDCEYYSTNDCEDCRLDRLTKIPAADVRPVVYGEWINKRHGIGWCSAECSICGNHVGGKAIDTGFGFDYTFPKFCDNCGADMTGGTDG